MQQIIFKLSFDFVIKDRGCLHYFLGVEIKSFSSGIFLSQAKYTMDLLQHAYMLEASPQSTSISIKPNFILGKDDPLDTKSYRNIVSAL